MRPPRLYHSKIYLQHLLSKKLMNFKAQRELKAIVQRVRKDSTMEVALGREGSGKSTLIAEAILGEPNSYYVQAGESTRSRFLDELIFQITGKIPYKSMDVYSRMNLIADEMFKKDSKNLIVIDDSGKLSTTKQGLGLLHELRDKTIRNTGLLFVGVGYFKDFLTREAEKPIPKPGLPEFFRRIQAFNTLSPLNKDDIIEYAKLRGLTQEEIEIINPPKNAKSTIKPVKIVYELEHAADKILKLRQQK